MSENENLKDKKNIKKYNKVKIAIFSLIGILVITLGIGYAYYSKLRNEMYDEYTPIKKSSITYKEVEGITNVLLVGTDGRDQEEASRADAIFIATLDNNNKVIKLTNIMRDILVNIPEYGERKINEAFSNGSAELGDDGKIKGYEGGVALLMETIEENFNIHLDKYIIVNFWGFESIIDTVGGLEIEIKDYELDEVNKYIGEATGLNSPLLTEPGLQVLNGQQALSYARIRNVGDNNFERGDRQSTVLFKLVEKLKEVNPLKYFSIANAISKEVKTNIDIPQALNLAYTIYKFPSLEVQKLQIPQKELIAIDDIYQDKGWCLIIDLEQSSKMIYDFIYNNKMPNSEEYDMASVENVAAKYSGQSAGYESYYEEYYEPILQEPVYKEPVVEEPVIEKPVVEENITEEKPNKNEDITKPSTPEVNQPNKPQEENNNQKPSDNTTEDKENQESVDNIDTNPENEESSGVNQNP